MLWVLCALWCTFPQARTRILLQLPLRIGVMSEVRRAVQCCRTMRDGLANLSFGNSKHATDTFPQASSTSLLPRSGSPRHGSIDSGSSNGAAVVPRELLPGRGGSGRKCDGHGGGDTCMLVAGKSRPRYLPLSTVGAWLDSALPVVPAHCTCSCSRWCKAPPIQDPELGA